MVGKPIDANFCEHKVDAWLHDHDALHKRPAPLRMKRLIVAEFFHPQKVYGQKIRLH
ncbi:hypothetical protein DPMN_139319 [Dreissena polymorpha]|uniref:Uncharacterized protein n=1 Tax=Dreissena polymorpha TaxID=45954 RepID=A0A9D4JGE5_DREPO|nr:hypothetical protein DPMN_133043 [Dreissena polymorpha]KAH3810920.1 hypothetical protein DPMN_139319 [Dreissena polymorpha]